MLQRQTMADGALFFRQLALRTPALRCHQQLRAWAGLRSPHRRRFSTTSSSTSHRRRTRSAVPPAATPSSSGGGGGAADAVLDRELTQEAAESYTAYAMSVIIGRALPDIRDGLKPVHRRILSVLHSLNLAPSTPHRKSARVVGEVLGKLHPHGDAAVYDALVRMAQPFAMGVPLIDGHGNFGSLDDDPPAAMRYTECRLSRPAAHIFLQDLPFETVDTRPTFDSEGTEPVVLPVRAPMILVNGATGIAVGMATSIPPHNLSEVVDGLCALIENPKISHAQLMKLVPGPDFPTGATLVLGDGSRSADMKEVYKNGRGSLTLRSTVEIEQRKPPTNSAEEALAIVITDVAYGVTKSTLVEKIANLVNNKEIEGVRDIRDESDRNGVRIVIDLKRGISAEHVLAALYKSSQLESRFNCNFVAISGGSPKTLSLKLLLEEWIEFRCGVIRRRTEFQKQRADKRQHIVQGLVLALEQIDSVVKIIRKAESSQVAQQFLVDEIGLSASQADAVLSMPLRRLVSMEADKLTAENAELQRELEDLQKILDSEAVLKNIVKEEARECQKKFGVPRRTFIQRSVPAFPPNSVTGGETSEGSSQQMTATKKASSVDEAVVVLSKLRMIKRMPSEAFDTQQRNTVGKSGGVLRSGDSVHFCLHCRLDDDLLLLTRCGRAFSLPVRDIPKAARTARGRALEAVIGKDTGPLGAAVIITAADRLCLQCSLLLTTVQGTVKRISLAEIEAIRKNGLKVMTMNYKDHVIGATVTNAESDEIAVMMSARGRIVLFPSCDVTLQSRTAMGMIGMKLEDDKDSVVGVESVSPADMTAKHVFIATVNGMGKRVALSDFTVRSRSAKGNLAIRVKEGDNVIAFCITNPDSSSMKEVATESDSYSSETEEDSLDGTSGSVATEDGAGNVLLASAKGNVNMIECASVALQKPYGMGVGLMNLAEEDVVASIDGLKKTE